MEENKPQKKAPNKVPNVLYVIIAILGCTVVGLTGYITYDKFIAEDKNESEQKIDNENGDDKDDQDTDDTVDTDENQENGSTDSQSDWLTYTSKDLGIKFKYPKKYSIKEEHDMVIVSVKLIDEVSKTKTSATSLVVFDKEFRPSTYTGTPEEKNTSEINPVTIEGKKYTFDKYIMGEGSFGGAYFLGTYLATIKENLYISILWVNSSSSTYCEAEMTGGECPGFEPELIDKYSTPKEDIETARDIVETTELIDQ